MVTATPMTIREQFGAIEGRIDGMVYTDVPALSSDTDGGVYTLTLPESATDNALRGEDYPALVKVWDNDVDAALYDSD